MFDAKVLIISGLSNVCGHGKMNGKSAKKASTLCLNFEEPE